MQTQIRAENSWATDSINIYLRRYSGKRQQDIKYFFAKPVEYIELDPTARTDQHPTIQLTEEEAQQLANQLWDAGIRPTLVKYQNDRANTLNAHLQDMRAIAFNKIKVPKP